MPKFLRTDVANVSTTGRTGLLGAAGPGVSRETPPHRKALSPHQSLLRAGGARVPKAKHRNRNSVPGPGRGRDYSYCKTAVDL